MATRRNTGMPKIVQMMGGAGSKTPVPVLPPNVERWGLNALIRMRASGGRFEGVTRWFDVHSREHIASRKEGDMWEWYRRAQVTIYLTKQYDELPTSVAYPLAAVQAAFGGTRLFCSGFDYMLALAMLEQFTEIQLYGFRLVHPQYRFQVGSAAWWLKQCRDRGITITFLTPCAAADTSVVDAHPPKPEAHHLMYGFETTDRDKLYHGR